MASIWMECFFLLLAVPLNWGKNNKTNARVSSDILDWPSTQRNDNRRVPRPCDPKVLDPPSLPPPRLFLQHSCHKKKEGLKTKGSQGLLDWTLVQQSDHQRDVRQYNCKTIWIDASHKTTTVRSQNFLDFPLRQKKKPPWGEEEEERSQGLLNWPPLSLSLSLSLSLLPKQSLKAGNTLEQEWNHTLRMKSYHTNEVVPHEWSGTVQYCANVVWCAAAQYYFHSTLLQCVHIKQLLFYAELNNSL